MRKAGAFLALLALVFCLTGCERYTEKEKDAVQQKGEQMIREWLDKTYPDAELVNVEPYIWHNLGVSPHKLTDLVSGTFKSGGQTREFWLDTADGTVYFKQSEETARELCELCAARAAEALGLGGFEAADCAHAYVDIGAGSASYAPPDILPADFVLSGETLESFVRSPKGRGAITVDAAYRVPDAFDVSRVTFAQARRVLDEYGLLLDGFIVEDGSEKVLLRADGAEYTRMEFRDLPDFRVWMPVYEREETLDGKTGKIETKITERDASRDLIVERTADGFYTPKFPNGYFHANVYAYEGSEMLRHTYYYVSDNDKIVELDWQETERGWRLGSESSYLSGSHPFAEKG